ncbi:hypothetical protein OAV36_04745 [Flavobacteriales bacterium]|nr:hypothetical protein [Flavobacteriales bacterium]
MGFFSNLFSKDTDWTINELAALVKSLESLAMSDGDYDSKEEEYIRQKMNELKTWKGESEFRSFQKKLNSFTDPSGKDLFAILGAMPDNKKQIVADTLLELSLVDGNCDGNELMFQGMLLGVIGWEQKK